MFKKIFSTFGDSVEYVIGTILFIGLLVFIFAATSDNIIVKEFNNLISTFFESAKEAAGI